MSTTPNPERPGCGTFVALELTNQCNLRCPHCPQGKLDVPTGFMSRQVLLEGLKYCRGYTELNWRGESLLHPEVVEFVRLAKAFNPALNLGMHSNGLLLTEDLFGALIEAGINWLHLSLHTLRSCERYIQAVAWNDRRGQPIRIDGEVDTTEEEVVARSLGLRGDQVQRVHLANWGGAMTDYRVIYPDAAKRARGCSFIKDNRFLLGWDGGVYPCCWDFQGRHRLGRVSDFGRIGHHAPYELCPSCLWIIAGREEGGP